MDFEINYKQLFLIDKGMAEIYQETTRGRRPDPSGHEPSEKGILLRPEEAPPDSATATGSLRQSGPAAGAHAAGRRQDHRQQVGQEEEEPSHFQDLISREVEWRRRLVEECQEDDDDPVGPTSRPGQRE